MHKSYWKPFAVFLVSILIVSALLATVACSSGTSTPTAQTPQQTSTPTQPTTPATQPIQTSQPTQASQPSSTNQPVLKIGSLVNMGTPQGVEMQKWMNLFAKLYNDQGGWDIGGVKYKVQPMVYDVGMMDPTKTQTAAEKAVLQDGVKYIIGTWQDVPAVTVSVTDPNHVLWMGTDFTNSTVDPKLNYSVRGQGLFFGQAFWYIIAKDMMAKGATTMVIVDPDTQQGKSGDQLCGAVGKAAGLTVLNPIDYPVSTTDFSPIATKVMSLNPSPNFVWLPFVSGDQLTDMVSALKDANYKGFILPGGIDATTLADISKKVGNDYIEGEEVADFDPQGIQKDPTMLTLMNAYTQTYGTWHAEGCWWIGPWFLFQDAVNNTQSTDVDVITKYLKNSQKAVATLTGYSQLFARPDLGIYSTIDSAPGHYLAEIKNGQFVPIKSVTVKDQYLVSIQVLGLGAIYQKYWAQYGQPQFPPEQSIFDFSDIH